jgi:hypothetical protein
MTELIGTDCIVRLPLVSFWGSQMAGGDKYRIKAAAFHARALCAPSPRLSVQYEELAKSYFRLAEQADRNDMADMTYEPPPPKMDTPDNRNDF